jgi:prefoldin subunit 5
MRLDEICDKINELEELIDKAKMKLEELYEERNELWAEERRAALAEYERSAL